jgi:hypothetical protein
LRADNDPEHHLQHHHRQVNTDGDFRQQGRGDGDRQHDQHRMTIHVL